MFARTAILGRCSPDAYSGLTLWVCSITQAIAVATSIDAQSAKVSLNPSSELKTTEKNSGESSIEHSRERTPYFSLLGSCTS